MIMKSVGLVIINEKEEVLILEHNKFNMKTIPIGKIEEGEKVVDALHREIKEEVGIDFINEAYICYEDVEYGFVERSFEHLFVVTMDNVKGTPINKEPQKHKDMYWVPISKLNEIGYLGTMTHTFMECLNKGYITLNNNKVIVNAHNKKCKLEREYDPATYIIK